MHLSARSRAFIQGACALSLSAGTVACLGGGEPPTVVARAESVDIGNGPLLLSPEVSACNASIVNGSFESPTVPRTWVQTFVNDTTGWSHDLGVEIWHAFGGVRAKDGKQHAEVSANGQGSIWQDLCLPEGTPLKFSFFLRGRNPNEKLRVQLLDAQQMVLSDSIYDATQGVWVNHIFDTGTISSAAPVQLKFRTEAYYLNNEGEGNLLDGVALVSGSLKNSPCKGSKCTP